jgi:hypothetical protein
MLEDVITITDFIIHIHSISKERDFSQNSEFKMIEAMSDKSSISHTFSCQNCGRPYTIYPPDSSYLYALMRPCKENDPDHNFKQSFECKECHHRNEMYWCPGHVYSTSSNLVSG